MSDFKLYFMDLWSTVISYHGAVVSNIKVVFHFGSYPRSFKVCFFFCVFFALGLELDHFMII